MLKKIIPFIAGMAMAGFILPALAQEMRPPAAQPPDKELRQGLPGKPQEVKKRLDETKISIITQYFEKMTGRLGAALEREKKLADRVESRIKKFEEKGAKVDEAKKNLSDARAAWQKAKDALESAKTKFEALKASDDPKAVFKEVRKLVRDVVDFIKKTHAGIVKTIVSLKGASSGVKEQGKPEVAPPAGGATSAPKPTQ